MAGRSDVNAFSNGASSLKNWWPLIQGGIRRRPGTYYGADIGEDARLIPFVFNDTQKYLLVLYNGNLKAFDEGMNLLTTVGSCPWTGSELNNMNWAISGDTIIVVHKDMPPQRILRTGASSFTVNDFAFETHSSGYPIYQPYLKFVDTAVTLTPSGTTGSITITASSDVFVDSGATTHVGTFFRIGGKTVEITAVASATSATATVRETLGGTSATEDWDEQAFSSVRGYPRAVTFYEQRLWFAGTVDAPFNVWGSKASAVFNFDTGSADADDSIQYTLFGHFNEIRHLEDGRHLQIFTDQAECFAPQGTSSALTPTNFTIREQTPYGAAQNIRPRNMDGATLFLQSSNKTLREFVFQDTSQAYSSFGVSFLADHLITSPVDMDILYGTNTRPEQMALVVNSDGTIAVFHSARNEQVAGFLKWDTDGEFLRVAVVEQDVFFLVKRTINSSTKYYLEKLSLDEEEQWTDCGLNLTASPATDTFTGLGHLEGETVPVVTADNNYLGTFTVTSGQIVLDTDQEDIYVGLNYTPELKNMPVDIQFQDGSILNEMKRVAQVTLDLYESIHVSVEGYSLIIRSVTEDLSLPPTAVTGRREFALLGWDRQGVVTVQQVQPLPLTIRSMQLKVVI